MTLKRRIQQLEKSGNITDLPTWGELIRKWQSGEEFTASELEAIFPGKNIRTFEEAINELEKQNQPIRKNSK
jgi:hypothetical protein